MAACRVAAAIAGVGLEETALTQLAEDASKQWTGRFNPRPFERRALWRFTDALTDSRVARRGGFAQDWPQFRGNPRLTGVATSPVPKTLKVLWTWEAGDGMESSPAISGGAVYVGSLNGELSALDLATGKLKWKYK